MFWHLRANLILCIDVALRYLKPVVKSSIARFGISYRTSVKKDDQEIKLSDILNIETWIKNDDTATLDLLQKGKLIKVEGFFKADTYTKDGKDFHVTKMTATKIELVRKTAKEA